MAVTLTVAELLAALRLGDSQEETAEVMRLLAYATEAVTKHAPDASETAMNEAVRRLGGYLFDMPEAGRGDAYANAMRNSGAARMLLPYRVHRLGLDRRRGSGPGGCRNGWQSSDRPCHTGRPASGYIRGWEYRRAGPAGRRRPNGAGFGGGGAIGN